MPILSSSRSFKEFKTFKVYIQNQIYNSEEGMQSLFTPMLLDSGASQ